MSRFQSDFVSLYYNNDTDDLHFWWERPNNHWRYYAKKDPLLEELEERISEGPVVFTPDEEFLERLKEKEEVQETVDKNVNNC